MDADARARRRRPSGGPGSRLAPAQSRAAAPHRLALVDPGGTLAERTPALRAALALTGATADAAAAAGEEQCRRALPATPGFRRCLAPRAEGFSLLALLRDAGLRVAVLTEGPRDAPQAWADKVAWCRGHLPGVPVIVTDDETPACGAGLVDDWLPYVERWQRRWPGALAVVPAQPWNEGMATGPLRLRDDGRHRAALRARLAALSC